MNPKDRHAQSAAHSGSDDPASGAAQPAPALPRAGRRRVGKPGAIPSLPDPRLLDLADYLTISKLDIPSAVDWTTRKTTPWGMMGNWDLGDCLCAAAGHMIECWTANSGTECFVDDAALIATYSAISGYDPQTGANDHGCRFTAMLKYWRATGVEGHRIRAFTAVKYTKPEMVKASIYLFGGVCAGFNLPESIDHKDAWEVAPGGLTGDNAPGSYGSHCVPVLAYDEEGLTCVTLGQPLKTTWEFWTTYVAAVLAACSDPHRSTGSERGERPPADRSAPH